MGMLDTSVLAREITKLREQNNERLDQLILEQRRANQLLAAMARHSGAVTSVDDLPPLVTGGSYPRQVISWSDNLEAAVEPVDNGKGRRRHAR